MTDAENKCFQFQPNALSYTDFCAQLSQLFEQTKILLVLT